MRVTFETRDRLDWVAEEMRTVKHPKPRPEWKAGRYVTPNPEIREQGVREFFRWQLTRRVPRWQRQPVQPQAPLFDRVRESEMAAQWIGHATVLVQTAGLNILTDPIWSRRCGPRSVVGPGRVAEPGVLFDRLPPIDVVLLSHDHYDHCDRATIRRLEEAFQPLFCVPNGIGRRLLAMGATRIAECTWWERVDLRPVRFVAVPAQHHSGRAGHDRFRTLWCGWVVETPHAGTFWFAGDTGWWEAGFEAIGSAFPEIRLAAIPIGAYAPRWFMRHVHINPEEAVGAFELVGAERALAIHHSTFQLSDEPIGEPAERLLGALATRGIDEARFRVLDHGEAWHLNGTG